MNQIIPHTFPLPMPLPLDQPHKVFTCEHGGPDTMVISQAENHPSVISGVCNKIGVGWYVALGLLPKGLGLHGTTLLLTPRRPLMVLPRRRGTTPAQRDSFSHGKEREL